MKLPHLSIAATAALALVLSACGGEVGGGSSDGGGGDATTLTIGYVSPQTGPLAPFGEADSFVIDQMESYFADNPLVVDGQDVTVKVVVKDAQSDSTRASEVAAELINSDDVDLLLASSTPDIVNPVSEQCEANSVPCITTVAPWQTVALREGAEAGRPAVHPPLLLGPRGRRGGLQRHVEPGRHQRARPADCSPTTPTARRGAPTSRRSPRTAASRSRTRASTRTAPRTSPPRSPSSRATTS